MAGQRVSINQTSKNVAAAGIPFRGGRVSMVPLFVAADKARFWRRAGRDAPPLGVEADIPRHRANGLPWAVCLPPSTPIGVPAGKAVAGPIGSAARDRGALACGDLLGTGDAAGRRASGVIAAVGHHVTDGRQRDPLRIEADIRENGAEGSAGPTGGSHPVGAGIPAGERIALVGGDHIGQGDGSALQHGLGKRDPLGGRAIRVVAVAGEGMFHPPGVKRPVFKTALRDHRHLAAALKGVKPAGKPQALGLWDRVDQRDVRRVAGVGFWGWILCPLQVFIVDRILIRSKHGLCAIRAQPYRPVFKVLGRFSESVRIRLVQRQTGFACLGDHDGNALGAGLKRADDLRGRISAVDPQAVFQIAATLQLKYALVADSGGAGYGIETSRTHRTVGLRIDGLRTHIDPAAAVGGIAVDVAPGLAQDAAALQAHAAAFSVGGVILDGSTLHVDSCVSDGQAPAGIRLVVPDRGGSSHDDLIKSIC